MSSKWINWRCPFEKNTIIYNYRYIIYNVYIYINIQKLGSHIAGVSITVVTPIGYHEILHGCNDPCSPYKTGCQGGARGIDCLGFSTRILLTLLHCSSGLIPIHHKKIRRGGRRDMQHTQFCISSWVSFTYQPEGNSYLVKHTTLDTYTLPTY